MTASVQEYSKSKGYKPVIQPIRVKGRLIYKDNADLKLDVEAVDRSMVQRLCKYNGLKANRSTLDMIDDLIALKDGKVVSNDNYKIGTNTSRFPTVGIKTKLGVGGLLLIAIAVFIIIKLTT